ncbi:G protein-coupled receptor [Aphelenchoides avenae]|nr:G protein-coupled receptor [Aphelenchus avenae]
MAFADLAFLFCMLPSSLASFEAFYTSVRFSYFFHATKTHTVALANMFSSAATWLVLAVSVERFTGIRRPMHTRFQLHNRRLWALVTGIFTVAFMLTFFHHIEYDVQIVVICNTVRAYFLHISQVKSSKRVLVLYVKYARYLQSIAGVAMPVIAVAFLNVSLIYYLRKREILPRSVGDKSAADFRRFSDIGTVQRQERKVTATVLAIVTCFSLTHLPTLGPFIWEQIYMYHGMQTTDTFNVVISLLNTMLVSGKVLNFFLFCTSSAHFRRKAIMILSSKLCHDARRKKYSSMATNFSLAGNHYRPESTASRRPESTTPKLQQERRSVRMESYRLRQPTRDNSTVSIRDDVTIISGYTSCRLSRSYYLQIPHLVQKNNAQVSISTSTQLL